MSDFGKRVEAALAVQGERQLAGCDPSVLCQVALRHELAEMRLEAARMLMMSTTGAQLARGVLHLSTDPAVTEILTATRDSSVMHYGPGTPSHPYDKPIRARHKPY